jgi:LmbE family N-acetylglucosaminyl deacetylase
MDRTMLVIGAHHDDCEYACGGVIFKALARGYRVVLVDMCGDYSSWAPTAGREEEVRAGFEDIAREMGVEKRWLNYGYHQIRYNDEGIRLLTDIVVDVQPQIAFIQWPHDYWPDHEASGKLGKHATWFAHGLYRGHSSVRSIYAYEAGPNQVDPAVPFRPDVHVDITEEMDRVCHVIHRLDEVAGGTPLTGATSHELDKQAKSRVRGGECGVAYAEAFVALRKQPQDIF